MPVQVINGASMPTCGGTTLMQLGRRLHLYAHIQRTSEYMHAHAYTNRTRITHTGVRTQTHRHIIHKHKSHTHTHTHTQHTHTHKHTDTHTHTHKRTHTHHITKEVMCTTTTNKMLAVEVKDSATGVRPPGRGSFSVSHKGRTVIADTQSGY